MSSVSPTAAAALICMTFGLRYLSARKPAGLKSSTNGSRISALTIAVRMI